MLCTKKQQKIPRPIIISALGRIGGLERWDKNHEGEDFEFSAIRSTFFVFGLIGAVLLTAWHFARAWLVRRMEGRKSNDRVGLLLLHCCTALLFYHAAVVVEKMTDGCVYIYIYGYVGGALRSCQYNSRYVLHDTYEGMARRIYYLWFVFFALVDVNSTLWMSPAGLPAGVAGSNSARGKNAVVEKMMDRYVGRSTSARRRCLVLSVNPFRLLFHRASTGHSLRNWVRRSGGTLACLHFAGAWFWLMATSEQGGEGWRQDFFFFFWSSSTRETINSSIISSHDEVCIDFLFLSFSSLSFSFSFFFVSRLSPECSSSLAASRSRSRRRTCTASTPLAASSSSRGASFSPPSSSRRTMVSTTGGRYWLGWVRGDWLTECVVTGPFFFFIDTFHTHQVVAGVDDDSILVAYDMMSHIPDGCFRLILTVVHARTQHGLKLVVLEIVDSDSDLGSFSF